MPVAWVVLCVGQAREHVPQVRVPARREFFGHWLRLVRACLSVGSGVLKGLRALAVLGL